MVTDPADRAVLTAIAEMARQMGLQTVAEGVENADQQAFVAGAGAGIGAVQGYLHSRPVPAAQLLAWLTHPSGRPTEPQMATS